MEALPEIYADLIDPTSNLAGDPCSDPLGNLAGLMAQDYMAADGTPIGRGNDCAPMVMGMNSLHGLEADRLVLPAIFEENRIEFGERWALPLLVGAASWFYQRRVPKAGLWTLAAYMAPLPVAAALATMIGVGATQAERSGSLGEFRPARRKCARFTRGRGPRRCIEYRRR